VNEAELKQKTDDFLGSSTEGARMAQRD
jgi:hypothetical protein